MGSLKPFSCSRGLGATFPRRQRFGRGPGGSILFSSWGLLGLLGRSKGWRPMGKRMWFIPGSGGELPDRKGWCVCSRASARGSWVTDLCIQTQTLNSEGKAGARAALKASAETGSRFYFLSFGLGKGNKALCGSQGRGSQTLPPLCVWKPFSGFPVRCELTLQGSLAEWGWAAGRMSPELEEPGEQRASTVFPC